MCLRKSWLVLKTSAMKKNLIKMNNKWIIGTTKHHRKNCQRNVINLKHPVGRNIKKYFEKKPRKNVGNSKLFSYETNQFFPTSFTLFAD